MMLILMTKHARSTTTSTTTNTSTSTTTTMTTTTITTSNDCYSTLDDGGDGVGISLGYIVDLVAMLFMAL